MDICITKFVKNKTVSARLVQRGSDVFNECQIYRRYKILSCLQKTKAAIINNNYIIHQKLVM